MTTMKAVRIHHLGAGALALGLLLLVGFVGTLGILFGAWSISN